MQCRVCRTTEAKAWVRLFNISLNWTRLERFVLPMMIFDPNICSFHQRDLLVSMMVSTFLGCLSQLKIFPLKFFLFNVCTFRLQGWCKIEFCLYTFCCWLHANYFKLICLVSIEYSRTMDSWKVRNNYFNIKWKSRFFFKSLLWCICGDTRLLDYGLVYVG